MERVLRTLLSLRELRSGHDDDVSDRLSRRFTTSMLVILALIVTTKQLVGEPINCWCPAHFTDSHRHYANSICWISDTFYLPFDARIPEVLDEEWKSRQVVGYYQWVPLILIAGSIMAFTPSLIWRYLNLRSGIDVAALIESASTIQHSGYAELRERNVRYVVDQTDRYLVAQRDRSDGCFFRQRRLLARYCFLIGGRRQGNYLTVCYLFVKLLYLGNAVGQLYLMEYVLGVDYVLYGFRALGRAVKGEEWRLTSSFPRVTLCSFQVRHQSRVHDYVVQCALTINLFNEKIFLILWFWYAGVATATAVSGALWTARAIYWPVQFQFVRSRIKDIGSRGTRASLNAFCQRYLRRDGLLLVRLISANVGDLTTSEILDGLWKNYCSTTSGSGSTIRIETEVVRRRSSTRRSRTSDVGNSLKTTREAI